MGRRKITLERIENLHARQICFSKRRKGLFRKTTELCKQGGGEAAVVIFSSAGNLYCYGYPDVDSVLRRYFRRRFAAGGGQKDGGEPAQWWDVPVEGLQLHELEVLQGMLAELAEKAASRAEWLLGDKSGEGSGEGPSSCVCQQLSGSPPATATAPTPAEPSTPNCELSLEPPS